MNQTFSISGNSEITLLPIDKDLLALLNRIIEQNDRILKLNERILEAFEPPRFLLGTADIEKIKEK